MHSAAAAPDKQEGKHAAAVLLSSPPLEPRLSQWKFHLERRTRKCTIAVTEAALLQLMGKKNETQFMLLKEMHPQTAERAAA